MHLKITLLDVGLKLSKLNPGRNDAALCLFVELIPPNDSSWFRETQLSAFYPTINPCITAGKKILEWNRHATSENDRRQNE